MVHNAEEAWQHVAKNILLLPQEDIDWLQKKRIRSINFFRKSMDLERLVNAVGAKDGLYYELEDFFKYMVVNTPTNDELMLLTHEEYCTISYSTIQDALEQITKKSSSTPIKGISTNANQPNFNVPQSQHMSPQSYSHIFPSMIRTVDFIRYTNFSLNNTEDILKFYSDVQTQGIQYNVVLRHIDDIQPSKTLFPSDLPNESIALISSTLINKFRQEKVIGKDYSIGQNLLKATTDGFIFLKQILMIRHPKFTDVASGLNQIPVYSTFNDLYLYARAIQDFVGIQRIEGRRYNAKEMSLLFLKYLDEPLYQKGKLLMQTRLEHCTSKTVPISLQVPGLATTISQQTLQMQSTSNVNIKPYDTVTRLSSLTNDTVSTIESNSMDISTDDCIFAFNSGTSKTRYQGTCAACGKKNHHESECNFLMKVKQCLAYMKSDRSAGSRKAKYYKSKGDYKIRRDKIRSLQERNFIPQILNPDFFLDIIENDDEQSNSFSQTTNEDSE